MVNCNRFFAFGCSFTSYVWPTWADIIGHNFKSKFYNYGKGGSGNFQMLERLMQVDQLYNINEKDLVVICWTNVTREDRWIKGRWETGGNVYTNHFYDKNFTEKYCDPLGYYIKDLAIIKIVTEFLKSRGCTFYMLSLNPLDKFEQWGEERNLYYNNEAKTNYKNIYNNVADGYKNITEQIKSSYYEIIYKKNWKYKHDNNIKSPLIKYKDKIVLDYHPTPIEHLRYLEAVLPEFIVSEEIRQLVNKSDEIVLKKPYTEYGDMDVWFDNTYTDKVRELY